MSHSRRLTFWCSVVPMGTIKSGCVMIRNYSGYGLSQWETTLQSNVVSHWLSREWAHTQNYPWWSRAICMMSILGCQVWPLNHYSDGFIPLCMPAMTIIFHYGNNFFFKITVYSVCIHAWKNQNFIQNHSLFSMYMGELLYHDNPIINYGMHNFTASKCSIYVSQTLFYNGLSCICMNYVYTITTIT